jgi:hypothetical protein
MNFNTILGFVRHLLTFGGGFFVSSGMMDAATLETAVGAIATLIGIVWSVLKNRKQV